MSADFLAAFQQALAGRGCTVGRREYDWTFDFGDGRCLSAECPWRIVSEDRIAHAGGDHGQKFGLPAPVDGEARSNDLLAGRIVHSVEVSRTTADVRVIFEGGTWLDLFCNSSGYESWQANFPLGDETVCLVGLGGGDVAISVNKTASAPRVVTMTRLPRG